MMATSRGVLTTTVDSRWLFNNFYVGVVIVDCRVAEDVAQNTMLNALHVPPVPTPHSMSDVDDALTTMQVTGFTVERRKLRDVVLVGDGSAPSLAWLQTLSTLLQSEGIVAGVSTLADSFDHFSRTYPFYTTAHNVPDANGIIARQSYPNEIIEDFLYLGNMWHAKSRKVIDDLGITHVVNATLDLHNVFAGEGVRYSEVKIPDIETADIAQYFNTTCGFIAMAQATRSATSRHRVLVHCTQGISRSATLVIMYVMRIQACSLVTAFNIVHRSRPVVIPNRGFFAALMADERKLFRGKNSLRESDIDDLLQGRIEDRPATIDVSAPPTTTEAQSSRPDTCIVM